MRFMVEFSIPTQHGNDVVRSGKVDKVFGKLAEDEGIRAGCLFVQSDDPAFCVAIGERLWLGLQAQVKVKPVMNAEELGKGLSSLPRIVENYA